MEEKKLTDEVVAENATTDEIIKAINYLAETGEGRGWIDGYKCKVIKFADVLDLIHCLQDERKDMHQDLIQAEKHAEKLSIENAEQKAEIERLTEENGQIFGKIYDFIEFRQKRMVEPYKDALTYILRELKEEFGGKNETV